MRAGAWDYLEKSPQDGSDPYDNLIASLQAAYKSRLADPELGRSRKDSEWISQHLPELVKKHGGRLVAVLDQQVVDSDEDYGPLTERLKQRFPMAQPVIVSVPNKEQGAGV
jgi:hypothetical protein